MAKFIKIFLILIVLYHVLITVIQYGIFGGAHPNLPAILRDGIRFVFVVCIIIFYTKEFGSYLKKRKRPWICLIVLAAFSVGVSYLKGKGISDMLIGIKYGFLYLPIFLSATFLGHIRNNKEKNLKHTTYNMQHFLKRVKYFLITTLIVGFIRQITKFIRPNRFMTIGYGPFQDFVFGAKPPIYYLTGFHGTSRRQGIFSGPNNYGYFIIAFLPAIIVLCKVKRQGIKLRMSNKQAIRNTLFIALRIAAIIATLSRTAAIGGIIGLAIMNFQWIKKHKKIARGLGVIVLLGILGLSALKGASTLGHIQAKFGSIKYVLQSPSGYGLGTSGPAVHHNGTILPENYFIQLILDIGTIGFILRALLIRQIQQICNKIKRYTEDKQTLIYQLRMALTIGWLALLIMGLFLHVFEDSMVNYIFFILRGLMSGWLFAEVKREV
ncbi:MAG: hypothetical protein NTX91_03835 [candidate division SR1 bacterium]|nr:hypothetical protein [candidate division SR1 bacterium]